MADSIVFLVGVFVSGLFLIDASAVKFAKNITIVAKRFRLPEALVTILTAKAEWEVLTVVVASLIQKRRGLALGNVVGSAISNILGVTSIGLLLQPGLTKFDRNSKLYMFILLGLTTTVTILGLFGSLTRIVGIVLTVDFVVYICFICWFIYREILESSGNSDSDSDDDEESNSDSGDDEEANRNLSPPAYSNTLADENAPLISASFRAKVQESTLYHFIQALVGFIMLSLSGYIISHSASSIAEYFGLADCVIGLTLISFATTLPEKLVTLFSGHRTDSEVLIANNTGSNIFLLTLCIGVTLISGGIPSGEDEINAFEWAMMWISSYFLCLVVFLGSRRWMGAMLLAAYLAFLILEFTVFRR